MNSLPNNELFSAYLDGELTAAEQAQMDHLLAVNPAARQLLDELQTLSTTLQSLPQQKVGEDLGPRVLRIAERRMLTEDPPGDPKGERFAAVPLARSIFRRFLQPRAVVWLSITAVVAVMLMINERRQPAPVGKADREVALAPTTPKRALPPSSISAAPDALAKKAESKPADLKRENSGDGSKDKAKEGFAYGAKPAVDAPSVAPPTEQAPEKPAGPPPDRDFAMAKKPASVPREDAMPSPSAHAPVVQPAPLNASATHSDSNTMPLDSGTVDKRPTFAGKAGSGPFRAGGEGESTSQKLAAKKGMAPVKGAPVIGKASQQPGASKKDAIEQTVDSETKQQGDGVLVVRCDVSLEALNNKAFDKLLNANGIAWREEEAEKEAKNGRGGQVLAEKTAEDDKKSGEANLREKQQSVAGRKMRQGGGAGPLDVVYVEATPAQIEATLAGLVAQPNVFLSVSVQPAPGEASQQSLSQYNRRGAEQSKSQFTPDSDDKAGADQPADRRDAPAKQHGAEKLRQEAEHADRQQMSQQVETRQADSLVQTQRVLFVLRMVGGTGSAAAAARTRATEVDASRQATEPAAKPVQQQKANH